jgi:hypothetical protein
MELLSHNDKSGLKSGLLAIDQGQIALEQGVNPWEDERQKSVVERSVDAAKKAPRIDL